MSGIRALQRRVAKLETARKPRPSPIVIMCGSFDAFADAAYVEVMAGTPAGDIRKRGLSTAMRLERRPAGLAASSTA